MECDFCDDISKCESSGSIGKCWRFKDFNGAIKDLQSQIEKSLTKTNETPLDSKGVLDIIYDEFSLIEKLAGYAKETIESEKWWRKE